MKGEFKDGNKAGNDYNYDDNGNLVQDLNKGIPANGITYNHLNLPSSITTASGNISYIYDASGTKLQKRVTEGSSVTSITDYAGNYIYENGDLQFFSHPEGYIDAEGSGYKYVNQYKDHLGNIRLSYQDADSDGSITTDEFVEERNYYPFGLEHKGYNNSITGAENNHKTYQGKELEKELGLNWHDFGARRYMADIGRWISPDPLSIEFPSWSPYTAMNDNPIMFVDPSGMAAMSPIYDKEGNFLGTDDQGLQGEAIVMNKSDFTQGMSHEKALISNLGAQGLTNNGAKSNLLSHYSDLKNRPDYDGQMSYMELITWVKENGSSPVFLDASKIDLGSISVNDFPGVGQGVRINTVGRGTPLNTYGPWGKNFMTLNSSTGKITLSPDEFDYRQHSLKAAWKEGIGVFMYETFVRYLAIEALQTIHGIAYNFGFMMYPYGQAQLNAPIAEDTFIRFGE